MEKSAKKYGDDAVFLMINIEGEEKISAAKNFAEQHKLESVAHASCEMPPDECGHPLFVSTKTLSG